MNFHTEIYTIIEVNTRMILGPSVKLSKTGSSKGCNPVPYTDSKHHLREKNIVHPTEKSENAKHFLSSQGRMYVFR